MTYADLHDFVVRTIPGALGTAVYAFTQLGPVAWVTITWVMVQMVRFTIDWYRHEHARNLKTQAEKDSDDLAERGYP